jgi:MtaA/CmuA family methyltransferase
MSASDNPIKQTFLPIVTTYTISSQEIPLDIIGPDSQLLAQAFYDYQQEVGYDSLPIIGDSTDIAEAFGCEIGFSQREPFVKQPLIFSCEEEVAQLDIATTKNFRGIQVTLRAVGILAGYATKDIPVIVNSPGPLTATGRILGVESLMLNMALKPSMIKLLLEKVTQFTISYTEALVDAGADIIFLPDPVASGDLISPQMFREFVFPMLKRQIDSINRPTILHICGRIMPVAKDMVETGATVLSVDQNTNIREIRAAVGEKVIIGGNLDPVKVLEKKHPEEVADAARRCCREGGGNFILMPGCSITPETPVANIKALIEVAKDELGKRSQ